MDVRPLNKDVRCVNNRTSIMYMNSNISNLPSTDGHDMVCKTWICKDMLQNLVRLKWIKTDVSLVLLLVIIFSSVLSGESVFNFVEPIKETHSLGHLIINRYFLWSIF